MIIGALVGGLILFFWQFLSWEGLQIHKSQTGYTAAQDEILACLKSSGIDEGSYFLPNAPFSISGKERQTIMKSFIGKPWATLHYHNSMQANMGLNLFRGFIVNFASVMLLCYILLGNPSLDFKKVMIASIGVGLISYMTMPYMRSIWFQTNSIPELIDVLVQWTVTGLFLAWYLPKK